MLTNVIWCLCTSGKSLGPYSNTGLTDACCSMSSDHSLIFKTSFVQRISKSRCNHHAMDRGPYCKRPLNETSYVAAVLFAMKMLRGHKDEKAKQWLCMITNRGEYSADIADYPVKLTMWWCTLYKQEFGKANLFKTGQDMLESSVSLLLLFMIPFERLIQI